MQDLTPCVPEQIIRDGNDRYLSAQIKFPGFAWVLLKRPR